jgi:hypothetical protein
VSRKTNDESAHVGFDILIVTVIVVFGAWVAQTAGEMWAGVIMEQGSGDRISLRVVPKGSVVTRSGVIAWKLG